MTGKPFHLCATDQRSLVKLSLLCKPDTAPKGEKGTKK